MWMNFTFYLKSSALHFKIMQLNLHTIKSTERFKYIYSFLSFLLIYVLFFFFGGGGAGGGAIIVYCVPLTSCVLLFGEP